jgi:hypothetical protein
VWELLWVQWVPVSAQLSGSQWVQQLGWLWVLVLVSLWVLLWAMLWAQLLVKA